METGSNIDQSITASGAKRLLTDSQQAATCRSNMGLAAGTPVYVNFYTFNEQCKGVDVDGIIGAVWLHEGYGSTHANGHESVARAEAVKPQYDPYAGAETLVDRSIDDLRAIVS